MAPCQTLHNRRPVIEKFFLGLSDIGPLGGRASRLALEDEIVRRKAEIQIVRLEVKVLWDERVRIVRQNKSAVPENSELVPQCLYNR